MDPNEATVREDDEFWLPIVSNKRKRMAEESVCSIVGALTRSKRRKLEDSKRNGSKFLEPLASGNGSKFFEPLASTSNHDENLQEQENHNEDQPEEDLFSNGEGPILAELGTILFFVIYNHSQLFCQTMIYDHSRSYFENLVIGNHDHDRRSFCRSL